MIGTIQNYAMVSRQIHVHEGHAFHTFWLSIVISVVFWMSTYYIVSHDIPGYIGYSLGMGLSCTYIAYKRKLPNENKTSIHQ